MIEYSDFIQSCNDDIAKTLDWVNFRYNETFACYFEGVDQMFKKLQSTSKQISDEDLEYILTDLPLNLYQVSENLQNLKIEMEVVKFNIEDLELKTEDEISASTKTAKKEAASKAVRPYKFSLKLYTSLIERVEREISFSRELIMSAKKIWTARRSTESLGEVVENSVNSELPEFDGKSYIRS